MAADPELIKRAEDLLNRCNQRSIVTHSFFLTPAEQYSLKQHFKHRADAKFVLSGGTHNTERNIAFFLPEWYVEDDPSSECISAVKIIPGFGNPGHRDYLGAVLALGIKREWIGDIIINEDAAYILCITSVKDTIIYDLDHVGRFGVKRSEISLTEIPPIIVRTKEIVFTVQSSRLDAITGAMFGISRSKAAQSINEGLVTLNYSQCTDTDHHVSPGDIISFRGKGKGILSEEGGASRKGRTYYTANIYI